MTQHRFDFDPPFCEKDKEVKNWVEQHNQQVITSARTATIPLGSLLSALDGGEAKSNAVYLLRGVLSQHLRKSTGSGASRFKRGFLQALRGEICMKKTSQDPAFTLRDVLIKLHTTP